MLAASCLVLIHGEQGDEQCLESSAGISFGESGGFVLSKLNCFFFRGWIRCQSLACHELAGTDCWIAVAIR